jgi:hypothetical protein
MGNVININEISFLATEICLINRAMRYSILCGKRKGEMMRQLKITYITEQFKENQKEYIQRINSDRIISEIAM